MGEESFGGDSKERKAPAIRTRLTIPPVNHHDLYKFVRETARDPLEGNYTVLWIRCREQQTFCTTVAEGHVEQQDAVVMQSP